MPLPYGSRRSRRIAELMLQQGDIAGRGALQSGQMWANAISGAGHAIAGGIQAHREGKAREAEDAATLLEEEGLQRMEAEKQEGKRQAFGSALENYDPQNPLGFAMALGQTGMFNAKETMDLTKGLSSFQTVAEKPEALEPEEFEAGVRSIVKAREQFGDDYLSENWDAIKAGFGPGTEKFLRVPMPEEYTPEVGNYMESLVSPDAAPEGFKNEFELYTKGTPEEVEAYRSRQVAEAEEVSEARARGTQAGTPAPPPKEVDDSGRVIAEEWSSGTAFPSTQKATTAALQYMDDNPEDFPAKPRKLSVAQQGEAIASADSLATIQDVRDAWGKVRDKVGPVTYRVNEMSRKLGLGSDPDFVTFNTLLRGMGNLEIKRITGAQMSEKEADRLLKGMATGTLKPEDFEAALKVMERNVKRRRDVLLYGKVLPKDAEARPGTAEAGSGGTDVPGDWGEGVKITRLD